MQFVPEPRELLARAGHRIWLATAELQRVACMTEAPGELMTKEATYQKRLSKYHVFADLDVASPCSYEQMISA